MDEALKERILIFLGLWTVLTLASAFFFLGTTNVKTKRRLLPFFAFGFGAVFLWMTQFLGIPSIALFVLVPAVVAISYLNVKSIHFCEKCGAYNMSRPPLFPALFCRKCGTKLEKTPL